ncbi:MAG: Smr/MutS family protein [Chloroflexi bacterium]|nr:Smr/MutS family protein [Chloroflexota bacterium]
MAGDRFTGRLRGQIHWPATLGPLRNAVRIAYDRLRRRLDSLVASELGSALQEPIITLRNGRYVVPVRADARSRVKGIVHDASGSGQTLFIEPLVVVELGNAWREAILAEQEEIGRIIDELSALVAVHALQLREMLDGLARFDFWAAKAALSADMGAIRAETGDRQEIVLLSARHPGLVGRVVPIDVRLGDGFSALVVTGPNTGGKTVTLRTLGLLVLMHQAGLHVPAARGSRLPVLKDVFADIGDEQSIAQSLSTFSGHLRSIIRIVAAAGPRTLVLLDELGAGTDPTEGSALAQALLDHFIRSGALIAATTHYAELKAYAHTTPGATNAAVEFDMQTLTPTYRVTIGLPGGSQAFAIAERLGLPEPIVVDARSRLTDAQRTFEATLAQIRETEGETTDALARARAADERAAGALRVADEERRRARTEREEAVRATREEAERLLAGVRAEVEALRATLERGQLAAPALDEALGRIEAGVRGLPEVHVPTGPVGQAADERPKVWAVGDRARSRSGGWEGRIAAIERDGSVASIESGAMRVRVPVDDLTDALLPDRPAFSGQSGTPHDGEWSRSSLDIQSARARTVPTSLDLRGARVEEALHALERYLEDASLAHLPKVTVIHGMGTGALRDAVRTAAAAHPLAGTVRPGGRGEGGDGATIVTLPSL